MARTPTSNLLTDEKSRSSVLFNKDAKRPRLDAGGMEGSHSGLLKSEASGLPDSPERQPKGRRTSASRAGKSQLMERSAAALANTGDEDAGSIEARNAAMAMERLAKTRKAKALIAGAEPSRKTAGKVSTGVDNVTDKTRETKGKPTPSKHLKADELPGAGTAKANVKPGSALKRSAGKLSTRNRARNTLINRARQGMAEAGQAARSAANTVARGMAGAARSAAAGIGAAISGPAVGAAAGAAMAVATVTIALGIVIGAAVGAANVAAQQSGSGGAALARVALAEYNAGVTSGEKYWTHAVGPSFVNGDATPWCSCFVIWCWDQCGFDKTIGNKATPRANSWLTWVYGDSSVGSLIAYTSSYVPKQGDIIVRGYPAQIADTSGHVGIVVSDKENGKFRTVEGNYSDIVGSGYYEPGQGGWNYVFRPNYPNSGGTALGEGVDFNMPELAFVRIWAPRIDKFYAEYSISAGQTVPLAGHGEDFARSAYRHHFDPRISPAISINESGGGRRCFRPYNAWGWMSSSWHATSWADGIEQHLAGLERGYSGLTLEEFAEKYTNRGVDDTDGWRERARGYMEKISSY